MLIDIIQDRAEEALITLLEEVSQTNRMGGALYFQFSRIPFHPSCDDMLLTVKPALSDKPSELYFFKSGDVVIVWKGLQKSTLERLCALLYERYAPDASEKLHAYYDLQAQAEELRRLCQHQLGEVKPAAAAPSKPASVEPPPVAEPPALHFSPEHSATFRTIVHRRKARQLREILIVEDQAFSRKLLVGMLEKTYRIHVAADPEQAWELYCTHAPDIVLLDIELPGIDGHKLAKLFKQLDPHAYIVMVSANNSSSDVAKARENNVRGFIIKPYSKQKILETLQKFRPSA